MASLKLSLIMHGLMLFKKSRSFPSRSLMNGWPQPYSLLLPINWNCKSADVIWLHSLLANYWFWILGWFNIILTLSNHPREIMKNKLITIMDKSFVNQIMKKKLNKSLSIWVNRSDADVFTTDNNWRLYNSINVSIFLLFQVLASYVCRGLSILVISGYYSM